MQASVAAGVFFGCVLVTEVYQELSKSEDSMARMTGSTELKAITPIIRNNLLGTN